MNEKILKIINNLQGSLLGIGFEDSTLLDAIENNDNIYTCYLLTQKNLNSKKFNMTKKGRNKKINIKKIRKYFKKKSIDTIICNYETIKSFYRSFIPNSIYLNKDTLYIYGKKEDLENLKLKYQRYTNDIEIEKTNDGHIMKINNQNTKNKPIKDTLFKLKDFGSDTVEIMTDLLINWKEI